MSERKGVGVEGLYLAGGQRARREWVEEAWPACMLRLAHAP